MNTTFSEENSIKRAPLKCEFVMFQETKKKVLGFVYFIIFT